MHPEARRKLDRVLRLRNSAVLFAGAACLGLLLLGVSLWQSTTDLGNVVATVTWAEIKISEKNPPWSSIEADLEGGKHISISYPNIPPPVPGEKIILQVRRNVIGYHSYKWIVGKRPALTPPPGSL